MERRQFQRADVNIMADYISPHMMTFDYLKDVSLGGAFLFTDRQDPVGTPVTLMFFLPNRGSSIKVKAEVAWSRNGEEGGGILPEAGMGLRFRYLSDEEREALYDYMTSVDGSPPHDVTSH